MLRGLDQFVFGLLSLVAMLATVIGVVMAVDSRGRFPYVLIGGCAIGFGALWYLDRRYKAVLAHLGLSAEVVKEPPIVLDDFDEPAQEPAESTGPAPASSPAAPPAKTTAPRADAPAPTRTPPARPAPAGTAASGAAPGSGTASRPGTAPGSGTASGPGQVETTPGGTDSSTTPSASPGRPPREAVPRTAATPSPAPGSTAEVESAGEASIGSSAGRRQEPAATEPQEAAPRTTAPWPTGTSPSGGPGQEEDAPPTGRGARADKRRRGVGRGGTSAARATTPAPPTGPSRRPANLDE